MQSYQKYVLKMRVRNFLALEYALVPAMLLEMAFEDWVFPFVA
jgi:hypothetical protein